MNKFIRHFFLLAFCTILPALLFMLVGCMKEPETNRDFGPTVTIDTLIATLDDADYEATRNSITNIKLGQYVYSEKSNQIENLFPVVFKQKADTIAKIEEFTNKTVFTITRKISELEQNTGQYKPSETQATACLAKIADGCGPASQEIPSLESASTLSKSLPNPEYGSHSNVFGDLSWRSLIRRKELSQKNLTFHNLKVIRSKMNIPPLVLIRNDWGGLKPKAQMDTIEIYYDEVDWTDAKTPVKSSFKIVFSPDAPFFASQMLSCGSTTIPYGNIRVALLQCHVVKDFTKEKTSAEL